MHENFFSEASLFWQSGAFLATPQKTVFIGYGAVSLSAQPAGFSFYIPDFFLTEPLPWLIFQEVGEYSLEDILSYKTACAEIERLKWQYPEKEAFMAEVNEVQRLIAGGTFKKAVPYAMTSSALQKGLSPGIKRHIFFNAVEHALKFGGYCFGFFQNGDGMMGVTPELLLSLERDIVKTVALAGTTPSEGYVWKPKELEEQALVIRGIESALAPFGSVTSLPPKTIRVAGGLYHLVSEISLADIKGASFEKLLSALHPTPALGTYPKDPGKKWLEDYAEKVPRGRYGAPFGFIDSASRRGAAYVAIRQIQWSEKLCLLGAGAGVTADSDPTAEWNEVFAKISAVRALLGI